MPGLNLPLQAGHTGGYAYPADEKCLQSPFNGAEHALYQRCFPRMPGGVDDFAKALGQSTYCGDLARRFLNDPTLVPVSHIGKGLNFYLEFTGLLGLLRRRDRPVFVHQMSFATSGKESPFMRIDDRLLTFCACRRQRGRPKLCICGRTTSGITIQHSVTKVAVSFAAI